MARELAAAERAAVYGRIGTCTQEFGTLASWLVDVLNVLTGNLDRAGGAMFTAAPPPAQPNTQRRARPRPRRASSAAGRAACAGCPRCSASCRSRRWPRRSRRPGEGQVRALITIAGNPALSTPNCGAARPPRSTALDFMVSLDIYVNETTRHADVILPGPSPLARSHYDLAFYQLPIRNVANYSPPALRRPTAMPARVARRCCA